MLVARRIALKAFAAISSWSSVGAEAVKARIVAESFEAGAGLSTSPGGTGFRLNQVRAGRMTP